jgi:superoxide dismutase, Cu-Zn family
MKQVYGIVVLSLMAWPAQAEEGMQGVAKIDGVTTLVEAAKATMKNAEGEQIGTVRFTPGPHGLLAEVEVKDLTPGWHAIHVHETGDCSDEGFKASGGHANPGGHDHGFMMKEGVHAGDMPNLWAHTDGSAKAQLPLHGARLSGENGLLDKDGAAVIIHAGVDDYKTQPSGDAGDRIACGVIERVVTHK